MITDWLSRLKSAVEARPIVILRFTGKDWEFLCNTRRGVFRFTKAYPHKTVKRVSAPAVCLIEGTGQTGSELWIGLIQSCRATSTFETVLSVVGTQPIEPTSLLELSSELTRQAHLRNFERRVEAVSEVVPLSPKLSVHIVDRLAALASNEGTLRAITQLTAPNRFRRSVALQNDAVRTALKAFGLRGAEDALSLQVVDGRYTTLDKGWVHEDTVIAHDARFLPGFELVGSYITGRCVFERGPVRLEVITANKLPLEEALGVDLILCNLTHSNTVMVQYKMLEPLRDDVKTDWVYRPDEQLEEELSRMHRFNRDLSGPGEGYRLNSGLFYLKFVKRDVSVQKGAVITPLDHFEFLRSDPGMRGPRNGFRISYDSLRGKYLREQAFLELVSAGYIGGHASTSAQLKPIIDAVLAGDRSLVAAIKSERANSDITVDVDDEHDRYEDDDEAW